MKIRECVICGKKFESHNGILVCSEECFLERKREQDRKSNFRRSNGLSKVPKSKVCEICGKKFKTYTRAKYCSSACYQIARKKQSLENFRLYYAAQENKDIIKERSRLRKEKVKKNEQNSRESI